MKYFLSSFLLLGVNLSSSDSWTSFKEETILIMNEIPGWCSKEKAFLIMDLLKETQCQNCIEIGVFAGSSLLPIAKTLKHNGTGKLYAIDAWDSIEAVEGFDISGSDYKW